MLACRPRSSRSRCQTVFTVLTASCSRISSWNGAISPKRGWRSSVVTSRGNQPPTSCCQRSRLTGSLPGTIPAATAGATYLRTVLRSTPRLRATSLMERPACQWTRISVMSTTWKVLLATLTLPRHRCRDEEDRRSGTGRGGEFRDRDPGELADRRGPQAAAFRDRPQSPTRRPGGRALLTGPCPPGLGPASLLSGVPPL